MYLSPSSSGTCQCYWLSCDPGFDPQGGRLCTCPRDQAHPDRSTSLSQNSLLTKLFDLESPIF